MSGYESEDVCLQCGQSRAQVKRDETFCGIVSGYEYKELEMEWPRHHWRDWSDAELRNMRISEHRWNGARRMLVGDLEWEMIASLCDRDGHREPDAEDAEWFAPGRCARCFALLSGGVTHD